MKRHYFYACSLIALLVATSGCAMCGSPFDYSYSAHGGKWQRDDSTSGRVGSLFDPAGPDASEGDSPVVAEEAEETTPQAESPEEPPPASEAAPSAEAPSQVDDQAPAPGALVQ